MVRYKTPFNIPGLALPARKSFEYLPQSGYDVLDESLTMGRSDYMTVRISPMDHNLKHSLGYTIGGKRKGHADFAIVNYSDSMVLQHFLTLIRQHPEQIVEGVVFTDEQLKHPKMDALFRYTLKRVDPTVMWMLYGGIGDRLITDVKPDVVYQIHYGDQQNRLPGEDGYDDRWYADIGAFKITAAPLS